MSYLGFISTPNLRAGHDALAWLGVGRDLRRAISQEILRRELLQDLLADARGIWR